MTSGELKIMLVDDNRERAAGLQRVLTEMGYRVVAVADTTQYLPQRVRECGADLILIDMEAPTRDALERISALNRELPRPIALFTDSQDASMVREAIRAGVSAYVANPGEPGQPGRVKPVIELALAHFQQYQQLRDELQQARASLDERKLIERAKGLLMDRCNLGESAAFARLRSMAMNRNRKLADVARDVIEMADLLTDAASPHTESSR